MILVIGQVHVRADAMDDALAASLQHVRRSRAEPGCLAHAVHRDSENPQKLVFLESWTDQAALAQHFQVAESRAFARYIGTLAVEPPRIEIYDAEKITP